MSPSSRPDRGRVFADLGKLRLETLLTELVERAGQLLETEQRVHRLLDAVMSVASNLALPDVLQRIVESSRELVGARYAALGVIGADGTLLEFLMAGISREDAQRIGPLPTGKGILEYLVTHPEPLRLQDLSTHEASAGFPAHHPPMRSFLGVPLHVRQQVFGNLYLGEKSGGGDFTEDDEEILMALAAAAGIAIENARLYEETSRRGAWLSAAAEITGRLLGGATAAETLALITDRARVAADADLSVLGLLDEDGTEFEAQYADGAAADRYRGRRLLARASGVADVVDSGRPQLLDGGLESLAWADDDGAGDTEGGSLVLVPLASGPQVPGLLVICRGRLARPFEPGDLETIATFATQAALALEYVRAQEDRHRLVLFEDRERIARDLHDLVIQRLFAVGLGLQGTTPLVVNPAVGERVDRYVADLDATIQEIRRTIFSLQEHPLGPAGLRSQLLDVVKDAGAALGFDPNMALRGPLDTAVPEVLHAQLRATLREALANVARHARAGRAEIVVAVDVGARRLQLRVTDDGVGIDGKASPGHGLANMGERAARFGGSFDVRRGADGGTTLEWQVPLGPAALDGRG